MAKPNVLLSISKLLTDINDENRLELCQISAVEFNKEMT